MAFTTIQGSGANDATSFVGSQGVDAITILNQSTSFFAGAQAADDTITVSNFTGSQSGGSVYGGQGADTLSYIAGPTATWLQNGFINGNKNNDTIALQGATSASVFGGQGNDNITAAALVSSTVINGNKFNDNISLNAGVSGSSIFGGQGTDTIQTTGDVSGVLIQGDLDADTITISTANASVTNTTVNGNAGNDNITANLSASASTTFFGGAGNDTITGNASAVGSIFSGDDGNDQVTGTAQVDTVLGGSGTDTITAANGADRITGGGDVDDFVQANGAGGATQNGFTTGAAAGANIGNNDTVGFGGAIDIITDFTATDRIDVANAGNAINLTGVANNAALTANSNYFVRGDYSAANNRFVVSTAGADTLVFYQAAAAAIGAAGSQLANYVVLENFTAALGNGNFI